MLNWLVVSNNEIKDKPQETDIQTDPVIVNTEIFNVIPKELLNEIAEFDHDDLSEVDEPDRYYFYDLLDEIKDGIELTHVKIKKSTYSNFLSRLQYSLEVIIVDKRIKNFGIDEQFSYTDKEYADAYKQLTSLEISSRYRRTIAIGFALFVASSIGLLNGSNQFLSGVYVTNVLLFGSFILNTICG
jgi:hypothetical protein